VHASAQLSSEHEKQYEAPLTNKLTKTKLRKYLRTKRNNNNYQFKSKSAILSEIKTKHIKDSVVNLSNTPGQTHHSNFI
jgi:hypothetical protein